MEKLKLNVETVEFDETLAAKNIEENGDLFKDKITDGFGKDQPDCKIFDK